ncbi:hypothetical protein QOZ80_2BG0162090 [Eleusine coracana subsp. coracana]|nr:hypothetical protein QOZ80_2BG0162090 [Eleusine coracana subsp. coracana]
MAPQRREKQVLAGFCDLVSASLLSHLKPGPSPPWKFTRQDERHLLLALSRVNKAIRGWDKEEHECESHDQETGSCSREIHSCCLPHVQHLDDGFDCLTNTVSILVGFLGFCSDYVKHSIGNILVSMSISLIGFDVWTQFIELIWAAIHASSTRVHNTSKIDPNSHDSTMTSTSTANFIVLLKLHSCGISGQMITSLFQVLHATSKFLKHNDSELKDDFICLSIQHIQKIPWESFHHLDSRELVSNATDSKLSACHNLVESGILTGSLLQLLCSLLEKTSLVDIDREDMYVKLVDILPKIAASLQEQHHGPKSLYQYSKHKILVVMMRLKPYMQQDCSHIICCLKLLRQYFQDLLYDPISQHIVEPDNCLEGSPFCLSMVDLVETQAKSNRHLQRRAIYLLLGCCICLSCNRNDGKLHCSCKRDDGLLGHEVRGCFDHCSCFGLSEISDWFERCYLDQRFDSKPSIDFSLYFLQLYIEEDDMLFSILLQLFDAPLISKKTDSMKATELIGAKMFSSLFDPVHLFHLLLKLLHYDHLVLVDYLISKDVGVDCAQYLLRCLRLISQSWHDFVDGSVYETKIMKLTCKRQRTSKDTNGARCSSSKEEMSTQKLFFSAKACLLSLKRTVEDLQKKSLFPYNPRPLIRSLTRFEELCEQG